MKAATLYGTKGKTGGTDSKVLFWERLRGTVGWSSSVFVLCNKFEYCRIHLGRIFMINNDAHDEGGRKKKVGSETPLVEDRYVRGFGDEAREGLDMWMEGC